VIYTAEVAARAAAPKGMRWVPIATLKDEALPNVMRKAIAHGLGL
jgi:A/G-specific adenine glycosylase